eukprot:CAMPEP_0185509664 /NCGR_PEP_ID=MMETSP1366-20130426/47395_1 /TAXON_ID=38817 /ORGANISM="Gephyrocapsa oceanica, Strain RCC1303" /LENGTH=63 /DNA_ID=CAMNT_0028120119 /DNA_START=118 /DNA_END=305 /DNA_ORIENTATION=+
MAPFVSLFLSPFSLEVEVRRRAPTKGNRQRKGCSGGPGAGVWQGRHLSPPCLKVCWDAPLMEV